MNKEIILSKEFLNRESVLREVINFLDKNKSFREDYTKKYCYNLLDEHKSSKENIMTVFINTINAAGGNNLTLTGRACKNFFNIIDKLPESKTVSFESFLSLFNAKNIIELFNSLSNNKESLPNFGKKKTALFIRDLDVLNKKLFSDYLIDKNDLIIPVDIVIEIMLNKILLLNEKKLSASRDFDLINDFFKGKLKDKFMLIEDLWFWGYFNLVKQDKSRKILFNEDKFYSDLFLYPSTTLKDKLQEFEKLMNKLGIK